MGTHAATCDSVMLVNLSLDRKWYFRAQNFASKMLQNLPFLVARSYCSSAASPAPATCPPALTWCCRTGRRWTRRTRWGSPLSSQTFLKSHLWSFIPQIHYNTIFARSLCADVLFNRKNVILWWVEIVWLQFPIYVSWFTEKMFSGNTPFGMICIYMPGLGYYIKRFLYNIRKPRYKQNKMGDKMSKIWYNEQYNYLEIWYCQDLCIISLALNILEGWDTSDFKGDVFWHVSSSNLFLYNIRQPK